MHPARTVARFDRLHPQGRALSHGCTIMDALPDFINTLLGEFHFSHESNAASAHTQHNYLASAFPLTYLFCLGYALQCMLAREHCTTFFRTGGTQESFDLTFFVSPTSQGVNNIPDSSNFPNTSWSLFYKPSKIADRMWRTSKQIHAVFHVIVRRQHSEK